MVSIAMMVGGALVNALAFTVSNFLFGQLTKDRIDVERKQHDLALEKLAQAKQEFEQQCVKYLDYLNQRLQQQKLSQRTFSNVDKALQVYNKVTRVNHELLSSLRREPQLSNFYTPSDDQRTQELASILGGTAVVGYLTYKFV